MFASELTTVTGREHQNAGPSSRPSAAIPVVGRTASGADPTTVPRRFTRLTRTSGTRAIALRKHTVALPPLRPREVALPSPPRSSLRPTKLDAETNRQCTKFGIQPQPAEDAVSPRGYLL